MQPFWLRNKKSEELMLLAQSGNTKAFEELYTRYSRKLLNYFYKMLGGNETIAQDFLHNIFVKIIEKPETFNTNLNFNTWIFKIANNMCKNEYRKNDIRKRLENDIVSNNEEQFYNNKDNYHDENIDFQNFKSALINELGKIDEEHRSAFILRFQENLSIKEIASITECAEGTIKSRLFYATRKLAKNLKDYNPAI